jgi:hypothetical protein
MFRELTCFNFNFCPTTRRHIREDLYDNTAVRTSDVAKLFSFIVTCKTFRVINHDCDRHRHHHRFTNDAFRRSACVAANVFMVNA